MYEKKKKLPNHSREDAPLSTWFFVIFSDEKWQTPMTGMPPQSAIGLHDVLRRENDTCIDRILTAGFLFVHSQNEGHTGETLGGLINATFGNIVEMMLCVTVLLVDDADFLRRTGGSFRRLVSRRLFTFTLFTSDHALCLIVSFQRACS